MEIKNKIAVTIINYNTPEYLKSSVPCVLGQTIAKNIEIIFIDNASPDKESLKLMHENYDNESRITIIANTENKGYAAAANQGIKMAIARGAEFVCILNPDVLFELDYFEKIIKRMKEDEKIASACGKIFKFDFKNQKPTDILDTTGLLPLKNRRVIDRAQGEIDEGKYNNEEFVFGVSGACPIYRVSCLEKVKIFNEYFDEDFFMYKEDIDLEWRLKMFGFKSLYFPSAVAYHGRGTTAIKRITSLEIIKNRKFLSKTQKSLSFRNQLLLQVKNEQFENFLHDFFSIMFVKIVTPFYISFVEPYLWKSYFSYLKLLPRALKKRKEIMKNKTMKAKEMRKWF